MAIINDEALKRTNTCGQLRLSDVGKHVTLCGWVRSYRDHGGVVFIDLRDRTGISQVVFDLPEHKDNAAEVAMYEVARSLRNEWVISITGTVRPRGEGRENPKIPTGQVEILGTGLVVLNESKPVPFSPDGFSDVSEDLRLKYRYIDLRRPEMVRALTLRHKFCKAMRDVLDGDGLLRWKRRSSPRARRKALATSSCLRACSRACSTPCRKARSSSNRF